MHVLTIYVYTPTHTHTHSVSLTHTYTANTLSHTHSYTHLHIHSNTHTHIQTHILTTNLHTFIYTYTYTCNSLAAEGNLVAAKGHNKVIACNSSHGRCRGNFWARAEGKRGARKACLLYEDIVHAHRESSLLGSCCSYNVTSWLLLVKCPAMSLRASHCKCLNAKIPPFCLL